MQTWKMWLHSLVAAIISGGANAVVGVTGVSIVLPAEVNSGAGLHTALAIMGVQFLLGAAIGVAFFLQKSPVPEGWDGQDRRGNTP